MRINNYKILYMPAAGLEPARVAPADFESAVSTNFTMPAYTRIIAELLFSPQ